MRFNGRFVLNLIHFAAGQGADMNSLLALTGYSAAELCQEATFMDEKAYNAVVEKAVADSMDGLFGLHAAQDLNMSAAGLIGQITMTCETVKQALDYCCEFAQLGCSALPMSVAPAGAVYVVDFVPDPLWAVQSPIAVRHTAEGMIAFTIKEFQTLTRHTHWPVEVRLPWDVRQTKGDLEAAFGCPVVGKSDKIQIILDKTQVEQQVVTSNYDLLRILVLHAQQKVAELDAQSGLINRVKKSIINLSSDQFPTIEQVAAQLNTSSRSLQRKLSDLGTSFKQEIENVRKSFALSYLKNPELDINQIAALLHYNDASAFIRSFKRWFGSAPGAYRG